MKIESTSTTSTTTSVLIKLEDAEPIEEWPGYGHRGKRVRPTRMHFRIQDGEVVRLGIRGTVLKKDGTEGQQTTEYDLWGMRGTSWFEDGWPGKFDARDEILRPLVEIARAELEKVRVSDQR